MAHICLYVIVLLVACTGLLYNIVSSSAVPPGQPNRFCNLPPEVGPCRAYDIRFYFNSATRSCETFVYGGCEGNGNNFETREGCGTTCLVQN